MRLKKVCLLLPIITVALQISAQSLNEDFSSTFPPEQWRVYSLDGGQFSWVRSRVNFFSCPACARVKFEGRNITNDDWLVTRKVYPTPGDNILRFFYRSHNLRMESLEVYVSTTGNQREDFQYLLAAFRFNNTSYVERTISLFQFDSTPISIAFRYPKRFGRAVYLDDISGPQYLPKDVGVKAIVSPSLYLLNGETVYPQVLVKNYGSSEQDGFPVAIQIIDSVSGIMVYNGLQVVNNLATQDSVFVTFSEVWHAVEGVYQVKAFTSLSGDMDLTNDTLNRRTQVVFSEIKNVAVTGILNPQGTFPPGVVTPQACVANYGTNTEIFSVNFDILLDNNIVYTDTVDVTLERNSTAVVDFSSWDATSGIYQTFVKATLQGDIDTTNNALLDMFEVISYYRDVGATGIFSPVGEILQYSTIQPQAEVENFGDLTESFYAKFRIGEGYEDSVNLTLSSGERRTVTFSDWLADEIGTYATKCSTCFSDDEDSLNDFVIDSVIVVPGTGINEGYSLSEIEITPNPFEKKITFSFKNKGDWQIIIYNSAGARVRRMKIESSNHWDGTDDKGKLLPKGIYFVKIEGRTELQTKKIIYR